MSECVCADPKLWTPGCSAWNLCPAAKDGGGLPLLATIWGGNATDQGLYRSLIGADVFFQDGRPGPQQLPRSFFPGGPPGPVSE